MSNANDSVLWLETADLPVDAFGEDLDRHFRERYPGRRVLIGGYLEIFVGLPMEILKQILHTASVRVLFFQLNHHFHRQFHDEVLAFLCTMPVTNVEIVREIEASAETDEVVMMIGDRLDNYVVVYECYRDPETGELGVSPGAHPNAWECNCESIFMHLGPYVVDVEKDIFQSRPLRKRTNCLAYDPGFASRRLIQRYNQEVAPDIDATHLSSSDAIRFFVVWLSSLDPNDIDIGRITFNLTHAFDANDLVRIFGASRTRIRNRIMDEIGAKVSEANGYRLTIR